MGDDSIIRTLRERVDFLEEENRQLRQSMSRPPLGDIRACFGLTPTETRVLARLMASPTVHTREQLLQESENGEDTKFADQYIHRLRRKLARVDVAIENVRGLGFRISSDGIRTIRQLSQDAPS